MKITIEIEVSDQLCRDIICTAVEGGIDYWAVVTSIKWVGDRPGSDYEWVDIEEQEASSALDAKPITLRLDPSTVLLGIRRVLTPGFKVSGDIVRWIMSDLKSGGDTGMIDANAADVIVQAAMFGEIVYG